MTVREGLLRSIIATGMKKAGVAIALLKLAESARAPTGEPAPPSDVLAEEEEAVLSRFVEREMRRLRGGSGPVEADEEADT